MNFQKIILASILCVCFTFFSNNLMAQTPQKVEVDDKMDKKENKMVLQKKQKRASKTEKAKHLQKSKTTQRKNKLYGSAARIERAKADLEKKKSQKKISQKEILQEEKKIKKSAAQLEKKKQQVSKFSEKVGQ